MIGMGFEIGVVALEASGASCHPAGVNEEAFDPVAVNNLEFVISGVVLERGNNRLDDAETRAPGDVPAGN